jgi:single-strand DNA-binding protein
MANEAYFAVSGYVATQPRRDTTKDGTPTLSMRVAWTPRAISKATGEWTDQATSFVSVTCYRKVAENAGRSLRKGDPVVLRGSLKVREYTDQAGSKRYSVEVVADSLGHDLSKGTTNYAKMPRHAEMTAEEYQSSTVAERSPLPGDLAALGLASEERDDASRDGDRPELPLDDADDDADMADPLDPPEPENDQPDVKLAGARARRR